ncbi:DNA-directed primase/polymerase protein-like [Uloborus diversus]|uniref:DNA-directed primase/polymerase protein-like n=1 Tax=Uloborus diversus TaxID=327109 RepID=UPI00240A9109|nr:DNA-directed primase/polymerase protein-like [Uloborus diversus]
MSYNPKFSSQQAFFDSNSSALLKTSSLWRRLQKTYLQHKSKPLPPAFRSRLNGPSASWKVFKRLKEACLFADSKTKDCMIFSFEERIPTSTGQRLFLVAHPQQMWLNHRLRPLEERCTYEVIREGFPCKLYFDLEFPTSCNSGKNGDEMTRIFSECVIALMLEKYNLKIQPIDFLWLDSSSGEKFSCHLILQMKNMAFQNNIEVGKFVNLLTYNILQRIEVNARSENLWPSAEDLRTLIINTKCGEKTLFCDEGVYTKNRNFRLYFSTKFKKNVPLVLSKYNQYVPEETEISCKEENLFYDSLITYFRYTFSLFFLTDSLRTCGNASSLCPELDSFILNLIKDDNTIGFIRKWTSLSKEQIIIYDIGNYRFCRNIGRHHKSNNIMIIVDLKSKTYYQKCHDPACKSEGYRSQSFLLPENVSIFEVPDDFFDYESFSQLSDIETNNRKSSPKSNMKSEISISLENESDQKTVCSNSIRVSKKFPEKNYNHRLVQGMENNTNIYDGMQTQLYNPSEHKFSQKIENSFMADFNIGEVTEDCDFDSSFECYQTEKECHAENSVSEDRLRSNCIDEEFSCADISAEEEMIIAEVTEVIEASFSDEAIFQETVF